MATKHKNKSKSKIKINNKNSKEIRYLEILVKHSLLSIKGDSDKLDAIFREQANRIQGQIDKLKENQ